MVSSVLPKEAEVLIPTAGNLGSEYTRNQVFIINKIYSSFVNNKTVIFETGIYNINIDLSGKVDEKKFLNPCVTDWGSTPDYHKGILEA